MSLTETTPETLHEVTEHDYEALYAESRAENERLKAVLDAARLSAGGGAPARPSAKAAVSADRVRALLGPVGFLNTTRDEKLKALGVDPASVTDDGLKKLFGRGADFQAAQDLQRSNPGRHATLRECAKILNLYAA
jgi:hypothetical protein